MLSAQTLHAAPSIAIAPCASTAAPNFSKPLSGRTNEQAQPQIPRMVASCFHAGRICKRHRVADQHHLEPAMKITIMTIIGVIAFFGALSLVSDHQPVEPHIIYTADIPNLQCPLEGACDNLNHQ